MGRGSSLLDRAAPRAASFDIYVEADFVLTELAAVTDVLRLANRVSQHEVFTWTYRSAVGGCVISSSAAMVETLPPPEKVTVDYAVFLGNSDTATLNLPLRRFLKLYRGRRARIFLLAEAASLFIQADGKGAAHTTHWENRLILSEQTDASDWGAQLASDHEGITTCAGMGSTVDLMLSIVGDHISRPALMNVADILLHDRIRDLRTPQPFARSEVAPTGDPDIDACITLMQSHMEEPLAIHDICARLKVSSRSLERKFARTLGMTPNSYYRELRLNKASTLLLNTSLSIREVGLACGFSSGFAPLYKSVFGHTPAEARRMRRIPHPAAIPPE